ncbi:nucleolin-like isoform X1 [Centroberyx affinis]|uniref:nucleolin-like isoform X1 n=1 Tax=Centroberyx affinis TaxID=166261 RepID=UPI003A5C6FBB
MAKSDAARRRKSAGKVAANEVVEDKEDDSNNGGTEEDAPTMSAETAVKQERDEIKEEAKDEQASQMDTSAPVAEEKESTPTVSVTWKTEKNEGGEGFCLFVGNLNNSKKYEEVKDSLASYFMTQSLLVQDIRLDHSRKHAYVDFASEMDLTKALTLNGEMILDRPVRIAKANDKKGGTEEDAPTESAETAVKQEKDKLKEEAKDEQASQMDTSAPAAEEKECTPTVSVTWKTEKNEGGEVNGKRKAESAESSPSKKAKTINDGFCLFVGNLNNSKKYEEVKNSLASYFMTQSLLVQDIRLDHSRKYAYVDLASEMDLTKALTLNGEMILEKPMKISKAKVKNEDKVNAPPEDKKAKDARCLFVKNVPYTAKKEDILKIFSKAIAVRFPGGTEGPSKGIAFVEFKTQAIAEHARKKRQGAKIQDRVVIVECVGEKTVSKASEAPVTAEAPPSTTLFVNNLSYTVKEKNLKKVFKTAVGINIPQKNGKSRGFAFVEFGNVDEATKALESSQNVEIYKRAIRVQFSEVRAKPANVKVLSKTLIVMGLTEKTSQETLKSAFEGSLSARVTVDKDTGVSRGFGFVDFESEESCKAAKEAMEDCEIDGSKVTVAYAKPKGEGGPRGSSGDSAGGFRGRPGGRGRGGRGGGSRGGRGNRGGRGPGPNKTSQDGAKGGENKG